MSVIVGLPDGSRVRQPANRFSAPFAAGQYNYTTNAANVGQVVIPLNKESIYMVERVNFSAQLDEGVWLESQATAADFPNFSLFVQKSKSVNIYPEPIRCLNYFDNAEQVRYFFTNQNDDNLLITFRGIINQVPATVGLPDIAVQVSFTIYQVDDTPWVRQFRDPSKKVFATGVGPP